MQTPESKYMFCFNFMYTFEVLNIVIKEDELDTIFEVNDNIITTYKNEQIIIKDIYKNSLTEIEKDYTEKSQEINNSINQKLGNMNTGIELKLRPICYGLDDSLLMQMNIASKNEKRLLGKEYKQYGLRPFLLTIDNSFLRGTSILSYLGSNIFSIQVIAFDDNYRLQYDQAVYLSQTYFSDFDISFADNSFSLGKGIESLIKVYEKMIAQSFKNGFSIYHCKPYEVLVGVDYWTDDNREIFYYLHQPLSRYRLNSANFKYLMFMVI